MASNRMSRVLHGTALWKCNRKQRYGSNADVGACIYLCSINYCYLLLLVTRRLLTSVTNYLPLECRICIRIRFTRACYNSDRHYVCVCVRVHECCSVMTFVWCMHPTCVCVLTFCECLQLHVLVALQ